MTEDLELLDKLELVMERIRRYSPEVRRALEQQYAEDLRLLEERARVMAEHVEHAIVDRIHRRNQIGEE